MAEAQIKIEERITGKKAVLQLTGELDAKTTPELKARLDAVVAGGAEALLIDMARLTYISSAGCGALNATLKALKDKSGKLILSSLTKEVRDTMDLMFFTKRVAVYANLAEGEKNL